jgi:formylmethanofuran dehydrogenase subunit C
MIGLYPLKEFRFPVFAECITPDAFEGKTANEIEDLKIWEGNRQKTLGQLFKVADDKTENDGITLCGDMGKVRRIGAGMKKGEIIVKGNADMHLGEEMKGGKIAVYGNVGDWTGSMMKGGEIDVHGNAGNYLGAPYRGSKLGMRGGRIIVHGNAGNEAGAQMKGGVIKVFGSAGQFVGSRMQKGTIYVLKDCAGRAGACMIEGKIVVGGILKSVLPSFTIEGIKAKVKVEKGETIEGPFFVFLGDIAENGSGKLYVSKAKNSHLGNYEKFLPKESI